MTSSDQPCQSIVWPPSSVQSMPSRPSGLRDSHHARVAAARPLARTCGYCRASAIMRRLSESALESCRAVLLAARKCRDDGGSEGRLRSFDAMLLRLAHIVRRVDEQGGFAVDDGVAYRKLRRAEDAGANSTQSADGVSPAPVPNQAANVIRTTQTAAGGSEVHGFSERGERKLNLPRVEWGCHSPFVMCIARIACFEVVTKCHQASFIDNGGPGSRSPARHGRCSRPAASVSCIPIVVIVWS